MRLQCILIRRFGRACPLRIQRRNLLTLAIETSCDDTSVAVLEKHKDSSATLHFHSKVTSDNRLHKGIHPIVAHESHQKNLASLVQEALQKLPIFEQSPAAVKTALSVQGDNESYLRKKPDFITVTRGPGMRASLITGVDTAKGLAVAWQIPYVGVNHMQAHALTPRLVSALQPNGASKCSLSFPFLTLLVSGGHTMLVHSRGLCDHKILANTTDIAIGDAIDKIASDILPLFVLESADNVMYGRMLESFVFPRPKPDYGYVPPASFARPKDSSEHGYSWILQTPYSNPGPEGHIKYADSLTYSGMASRVRKLMSQNSGMDEVERQTLGRVAMTVAFEHLASRILYALDRPEVKDVSTLVVSGGVASNQFLKTIIRANLDAKGFQHVDVVFPPPEYCVDNAAMIAWTGIEMFEAGWRSTWDACAFRKWSIDPTADDGGILGVDGWEKADA